MTDHFAPWFDWKHPMNVVVHRRPTIEELERILKSDADMSIEILPNGEVRAVEHHPDPKAQKPITMRDNLGGEYGYA
jgi:hypothetical protein